MQFTRFEAYRYVFFFKTENDIFSTNLNHYFECQSWNWVILAGFRIHDWLLYFVFQYQESLHFGLLNVLFVLHMKQHKSLYLYTIDNEWVSNFILQYAWCSSMRLNRISYRCEDLLRLAREKSSAGKTGDTKKDNRASDEKSCGNKGHVNESIKRSGTKFSYGAV